MTQPSILISLVALLAACLALALSIKVYVTYQRLNAVAAELYGIAASLQSDHSTAQNGFVFSIANIQKLSENHDAIPEMHRSAARAYLNEVSARRAEGA